MSRGRSIPGDIAALTTWEDSNAPKAGDVHVELLAASTRGAPNVEELNVVKVGNQGFKELDDVYVVLYLAQVQRLVSAATRRRRW